MLGGHYSHSVEQVLEAVDCEGQVQRKRVAGDPKVEEQLHDLAAALVVSESSESRQLMVIVESLHLLIDFFAGEEDTFANSF